MSYDPEPLISEETARFLEEELLLTPVVGQKRKISASMLAPPTPLPPSTASSCRVSSASFSALSVGQEVDEIEIPADLRSRETFEFLGFTNETAEILWERFLNQPPEMGADLINFARWHVRHVGTPDPTCPTDDWEGTMLKMGLNDRLRQVGLLQGIS